VSLSYTAPSGITVSFSPTSIALTSNGSGSSTVTVSVVSSMSPRTYTVSIIGTSGALEHLTTISVIVNSYPTGGGGGSVAFGTLITLANGTAIPVQDIQIGNQVIVYNVPTAYQTIGIVDQILVTLNNSTITLHTTAGLPFRADANPYMRLWVLTNAGPTQIPITLIKPGDQIYNYDLQTWVNVTKVTVSYGGEHVMYDLITDPNHTSTGQILEYIANGYPDCPANGCKIAPSSSSIYFVPAASWNPLSLFRIWIVTVIAMMAVCATLGLGCRHRGDLLLNKPKFLVRPNDSRSLDFCHS
jgi:hypothetical protein